MRLYLAGAWHLLELPAAVAVGQWPAQLAVWKPYSLVFALRHPPWFRPWLQRPLLYLLHRQQPLQSRRLRRLPWRHPLHDPLLPAWRCPQLPVALLSFARQSWWLAPQLAGQFPIVAWLKRSIRFRPSIVDLRSADSSGTHTCQRS